MHMFAKGRILWTNVYFLSHIVHFIARATNSFKASGERDTVVLRMLRFVAVMYRVQKLRQRAHELSASVQTQLLDRLEARRLQRLQSTSSSSVEIASDAVDASSTQADVLQRTRQCLQAVQTIQVTQLTCRLFCLLACYTYIQWY